MSGECVLRDIDCVVTGGSGGQNGSAMSGERDLRPISAVVSGGSVLFLLAHRSIANPQS